MRRMLIALLMIAAAGLGVWLFASVKDSNQLSLAIAAKKPDVTTLPELVGGTTSATVLAQQVTTTAVLLAPRYTGRDEKGRTWEIVADKATQTGGAEASVIGLEAMTVMLDDPSRSLVVRLSAPAGSYATASETVLLSGGMETTVEQQGETLWLKAPQATGSLLMAETQIKLTGGVTGRITTKD